MADRTIRIGKVSSVDYGSGMIKVVYPDLDNSVTDDLPYLTFNDEYKMPKVGASVLVVHLSNGAAAGIVCGTYWNDAPLLSTGKHHYFYRKPCVLGRYMTILVVLDWLFPPTPFQRVFLYHSFLVHQLSR